MTPLDLARNLAADIKLDSRALAVAIVARALSDDDPATLRQGWPIEAALPAAATYLGLSPTVELIERAREIAPTVSDAMLNKHA